MGMLSYFYRGMKNKDKATIAQSLYGVNYQTLESWLRCMTDLRNRCAHYSRIYYWVFPYRWKSMLKNWKTARCYQHRTAFRYISGEIHQQTKILYHLRRQSASEKSAGCYFIPKNRRMILWQKQNTHDKRTGGNHPECHKFLGHF